MSYKNSSKRMNEKELSTCWWMNNVYYWILGIIIGVPMTMALVLIYRRGCFGILGYRPNPSDYGRAFYKRTELREDLYI